MAAASKLKTTYTRVEMYVGYTDRTWDCEHFVFVPNNLMRGWREDGLLIEDVAIAAFEAHIDLRWRSDAQQQVSFVGVHSMTQQDEEGEEVRPRKDDVQAFARDVKKAAKRRDS